eukprot:3254141-Karenia_brevis.AAC.1
MVCPEFRRTSKRHTKDRAQLTYDPRNREASDLCVQVCQKTLVMCVLTLGVVNQPQHLVAHVLQPGLPRDGGITQTTKYLMQKGYIGAGLCKGPTRRTKSRPWKISQTWGNMRSLATAVSKSNMLILPSTTTRSSRSKSAWTSSALREA